MKKYRHVDEALINEDFALAIKLLNEMDKRHQHYPRLYLVLTKNMLISAQSIGALNDDLFREYQKLPYPPALSIFNYYNGGYCRKGGVKLCHAGEDVAE